MEVRPVTTLNWLAQEVLTFALRQDVAVLAKVPLYRVRLSGWALKLDIKNAKYLSFLTF
ncbi:hypothetical protein [Alteribacillus sp. YIM 98480]|uniref:hypothetical protein n=1 Tax=Alteribacillus sp. YIM 98480 TaxID=2606599 RepID=UPI00131E4A1A|nr:hypothetical protein [Alteribacillus sp. YIM 98480]